MHGPSMCIHNQFLIQNFRWILKLIQFWFIFLLVQYLCELSLLEAEPYLQYPPSMVSAAAIALARLNFNLPIWTEQLEELTGLSIHKLYDLIHHLSQSHCAAIDSPQQAIQDKYKHSK